MHAMWLFLDNFTSVVIIVKTAKIETMYTTHTHTNQCIQFVGIAAMI